MTFDPTALDFATLVTTHGKPSTQQLARAKTGAQFSGPGGATRSVGIVGALAKADTPESYADTVAAAGEGTLSQSLPLVRPDGKKITLKASVPLDGERLGEILRAAAVGAVAKDSKAPTGSKGNKPAPKNAANDRAVGTVPTANGTVPTPAVS